MRRLLIAGVLLLAACGSASTASGGTTTAPVTTAAADATTTAPTEASTATTVDTTTAAPSTTVQASDIAGATRYKLSYGPLTVHPGQNLIQTDIRNIPKPPVSGYIVRFAPNLERADGTIPPVDVDHLHHGVWLNANRRDITTGGPERFVAAGEEKTIVTFPTGFGYRFDTTDRWVINYMLHDLLPTPDTVYLTLTVDLIADGSPQAATTSPVRPVWVDVDNGSGYPVFDVIKGAGTNGTYRFPEGDPSTYDTRQLPAAWTSDRAGVLVATAGHLHPGGLHTDLWLKRPSATGSAGSSASGHLAHLFTSEANYYEPAGAVSWDVSMTATPSDWRVALHKGDVLSVSATYDSANASWYESMGIMVVWLAEAPGPTGADPFATKVDVAGAVTHGHLDENSHHGGGPTKLPDPATLPATSVSGPVDIRDFTYALGDFSEGTTQVPTVKPGQAISFTNSDASVGVGIPHTITSCAAPCNGETGVAFPLANGATVFDSGELGTGGAPTADRTTWSTPTNLKPGTYTYFCRIHPFMRGAFRVAT